MPQIRIQHFGPIVDSGDIDIKKNTFFIGNQGTGKSTIAKLISLMMWLEKSYNRGDFSDAEFINLTNSSKLYEYSSIHNYFKPNKTRIDFYGDKFNITIYPAGGKFSIVKNGRDNLIVPMVMYIPDERNFFSTLKDANKVGQLPGNLREFGEELRLAERSFTDKIIDLKIGNFKFTHIGNDKRSIIIGKDYRIDLSETSSGIQSYTPLFLVSKRISELVARNDEKELLKTFSVESSLKYKSEVGKHLLDSFELMEDETNLKVKKIQSKYFPKCFINIVEEPEQNLFPDSQWEVLKTLVKFNNSTKENKLIVTTHSPYIINYLSIAAQGEILKQKIKKSKKESLQKELYKIIPEESLVNPDDIAIYQVKEDGKVDRLVTFEGIPTDKNFLNDSLREGNMLFDQLLEIEEEL